MNPSSGPNRSAGRRFVLVQTGLARAIGKKTMAACSMCAEYQKLSINQTILPNYWIVLSFLAIKNASLSFN